jgi:hypothetical protein
MNDPRYLGHLIEPIESARHARPFRVQIDGRVLLDSSGRIVRYKSSETAMRGGEREVDRRNRFAVTQASRLPAASDSNPSEKQP